MNYTTALVVCGPVSICSSQDFSLLLRFSRSKPATAGLLHTSGPAVPDRHLVSLDDDRYIALAFCVPEHLIELHAVQFHIDVDSITAKGLTGLFRIWSACLSEYCHLIFHGPFSSS